MSKLTLVRGLPGSGKSTLAERLAANTNAVWLEADHYFLVPYVWENIYLWTGDLVKDAHRRCYSLTEEALRCGHSVVVSNTFTRVWEMKGYFTLAKLYSVDIEVIACKNQFGSRHNVPEEKLAAMAARWEDYDGESIYNG